MKNSLLIMKLDGLINGEEEEQPIINSQSIRLNSIRLKKKSTHSK